MVVARHIKDPLAIHSKAEMTNAVMSLLDQVAKLSERNSQLSEQSSQLTEQNSQFSPPFHREVRHQHVVG